MEGTEGEGGGQYWLFFLEHAGELRIIILIEEKKKSYRG